MKALVTGSAGFVGSHLAERLLSAGHEVVAVDCFTPYYDVGSKVDNVGPQRTHEGCTFVQADLRTANLDELMAGVDVVFHQAAQAGVRASWDQGFGDYATHNVLATQRLLEAAMRIGPRQRPDMGIHRRIESALHQLLFPLFGTESQVREFTFVDDIVSANLAAATQDVGAGEVFKISGGSEIALMDLIDMVGEMVGSPVVLEHSREQPGDVVRNGGATERAARSLGWKPLVGLRDGLEQQIAWHRSRIK